MSDRASGPRAVPLVFALLMAAGMFLQAAPVGAATARPDHRPAKVSICHRTRGSAPWKQITISSNALPAHLAHPWGPDLYPVPAGGCPGTTTTTSTTRPGNSCDDYTPTHLAVDPTTVAPGGTVTITGIAKPGATVTATFDAPPGVIGTAVAGPTGQFSIVATVPASASLGAHQITVSSGECPAPGALTITVMRHAPSSCSAAEADRTWQQGTQVAWTLITEGFDTSRSVTLTLTKRGYRAVLYSGPWPADGVVTFTVPTDPEAIGALTIEQKGSDRGGHGHRHGDSSRHEGHGTIKRHCGGGSNNSTCTVWITPTAPVAPVPSSCAATDASRTWAQGTKVEWTLITEGFDTSRSVALTLVRRGYRAELYSGRWPAGGTVTFTVPTDRRADGQLTIEQKGSDRGGHGHRHGDSSRHEGHGTVKRHCGSGSNTSSCTVWVHPAGQMQPVSFLRPDADDSQPQHQALAVGAVLLGMYALVRVGARRARVRPVRR